MAFVPIRLGRLEGGIGSFGAQGSGLRAQGSGLKPIRIYLMDLDFSDQQREFQQRIADFARGRIAPEAAAIDEHGRFPRALVAEMAALGLLGVTIPIEWG